MPKSASKLITTEGSSAVVPYLGQPDPGIPLHIVLVDVDDGKVLLELLPLRRLARQPPAQRS